VWLLTRDGWCDFFSSFTFASESAFTFFVVDNFECRPGDERRPRISDVASSCMNLLHDARRTEVRVLKAFKA